jgi:hypothetical protein
MGRARDIANIINSGTFITPASASTTFLTQTSASTIYAPASAGGLVKIIPSGAAAGTGSYSISSTGTVTFSNATVISLNECFNSTYDNYRIQLELTSGNCGGVRMRMRSGTTDISTSTYHHVFNYSQMNTPANFTTNTSNASTTSMWVSDLSTNGIYSHSSFDVSSPFLSLPSVVLGQNMVYQNSGASLYGIYFIGSNTNSTSYSGMSLVPDSNSMTGTIRVYGYRN